MADVKISQLPAATVVNANDILVLNQGGATKTAAQSLVVAGLATTSQLSSLTTTAQVAAITTQQLSAISISAGTGLTGGGPLSANSTMAIAALSPNPTGTYGSSTQIPVLTVNQIGQVTGVTTQAVSGGGSTTPTNVQVFTSSGTWTKPAGAKMVHIQCIGGGGGGGSGRASASGTAAGGGGGGASGARTFMFIDASFFGATETVTVGAFGTGAIGVAPGASGTNGNIGGSGTASSFGSSPVWVYAGFGGGGNAGTSTTGGSGGAAAFRGLQAGVVGGSASSSFAAGGAGNNGTGGAPASGGGGGGITSAGVVSAPGAGGFQFIINGGTVNQTPANTAGFSVPTNSPFGGSGGGGGSGSTTGTASNGGAGGNYGAGGGGGGPAVGFASGSGGDGAPGIVVVTTFF